MALHVDNEFTQNYEELIRLFSKYAEYQNDDKDIEMRLVIISHVATKIFLVVGGYEFLV